MFLAGDIGGTRSRFYALEGDRVVFEHIYSSKEHKDFISIVENFLKLSGLKFSKCVFGIAGVVIDGCCKTTNLPWVVSIHEIKKTLELSEGYLINDLELLTYGVLTIPSQGLETLQTGEKKQGPALVVCPGTGLGVACALHAKMPFDIFPTEAGHADFAPINHQEVKLLERYIDKMDHVSTERFVSGSGLLNIYSFLTDSHKTSEMCSSSEEITEKAFSLEDPTAIKTCQMFLDMLASTIGNLALNYIPYRGVYICGALMRRLHPMIQKKEFLDRVTNKGRFSHLLKKIPIYVVKEQKLAVLGALMFFKNLKEVSHEHS